MSNASKVGIPAKVRWRHLPRFYVEAANFNKECEFELQKITFQHAIQARRLKVGQYFIVFEGKGIEYLACLQTITRSGATACWHDSQIISRESSVNVGLVVGLIASEKMDWIIQKATELGVASIQPVLTQHSFQMASHRFTEKERHWNGIIIAACEQSGRNSLPCLRPVKGLEDLFNQKDSGSLTVLQWLLSPFAEESLVSKVRTQLPLSIYSQATQMIEYDDGHRPAISLFIGPEGGFSEQEESLMRAQGCIALSVGERILRAETAAIAALSQVLLV